MKYNGIPKVLLLGNGINRAFGASSWDDIINNLSIGEFDSLTGSGTNVGLRKISKLLHGG